MSQSYVDEYFKRLNIEVESVKDRLANGETIRDLIMDLDVSRYALEEAKIPPSFLTPKKERAKLSFDEMDCHIPNEGKWEYFGGHYFGTTAYGEESVLMLMLSLVGFDRLIDLLPEESIQALKESIADR